ncbi:MAG: response regulator [Spirochaetaceae bacterium]
MGKEEELQRRLHGVFILETEERLQGLTTGFLELEKGLSDGKTAEIFETIYRDAHSLKGASRSVGRGDMETIFQSMESLLAIWKKKNYVPSADVFDELHKIIEGVRRFLDNKQYENKALVTEYVKILDSMEKSGEGPDWIPELKPEIQVEETGIIDKNIIVDTVRISMSKLDSILRQSEELLLVKLVTAQRAGEILILKNMIDKLQHRWNITLESMISQPTSLGDFINWQQNQFQQIDITLTELQRKTEGDSQSLGRRVDNLLEDSRKMLLFPVSSILQTLPKMVRDLCRENNKEVDLNIQGGEFEVDKRILEEMKDPIIHIIRNSLDHGIEKTEVREKNKKVPKGTISIIISPKESDKVEISIKDDGRGIDLERVKESAVQKGFISRTESEKYNEVEALQLIFLSEVSTSPLITKISGRGLGMAIVREKVEDMGGAISIETKQAEGTTFHLILPLTISTFRGVLIQVVDQLFVIPAMNVERVGRINIEDIKTIENKETINHQGRTILLVELSDVLGIHRSSETSKSIPYIIIRSGDKIIAFSVQAILNEEEVLVKSLGKQLPRVRNIGGATVLGSGMVVPVLNVSDLLKSASKTKLVLISRENSDEKQKKKNSILVVEDSITSRILLKNILESGGYLVKTAVDGIDAFTQLKTEVFQLVVSDIQMPRMNGFELTKKIRNEKTFSELPVVLVTSLESREDQEKGIEVGADAYILKASFDQSNLLEVIGRFL